MIWQQCAGERQIKPLSGSVYRIVENQQPIANSSIVDTLAEQSVLEEMLKVSVMGSKNNVENKNPKTCHYLLSAPFREPPLKHGSRFGTRQYPSIFYGASELKGALTEHAYYRFIFASSITGPWPSETLLSSHTVFSVKYHTPLGIKLNSPPFNTFERDLTNPTKYTASQLIGLDMRNGQVEMFTYTSARDNRYECVGIFTPQVFTSSHPERVESWLCELTPTSVQYKQANTFTTQTLPLSQFLIDGELPNAAL